MNITLNLLKAEHVGVRAFRSRLFEFLKDDQPLVITEHGQPIRVVLDYNDILDLLDILDELSDPETVNAVRKSRKAIADGIERIPASKVFDEIRSSRKKK